MRGKVEIMLRRLHKHYCALLCAEVYMDDRCCLSLSFEATCWILQLVELLDENF